MNQIPNIEETHNTEVERIVEEYYMMFCHSVDTVPFHSTNTAIGELEWLRTILTTKNQQCEARIKEAVEQTEKAFGGCKKCYGKGYSTVIDSTTYHADFPGDKTYSVPNNPIRYCSCDRGKQLEALNTTK